MNLAEAERPRHADGATAEQLPRLSICIVTHDRAGMLAETLGRMQEVDYPSELLEFIVVDNASGDGTVEMLRREFPAVELIVNDGNAGAPAWNRAFDRASGDFCLILDDDCYLRPEAMRIAMEAAHLNQADLVSLAVVSGEDAAFRFDHEYRTGLLSFWGCAAFVSRRVIETCGGYDPYIFVWGNELELTMRILDRGLRHLFVEEAVAVHLKSPRAFRASSPDALSTNLKHFSYVAAKHMRRRDAVGACGNLLLHAALLALQRGNAASLAGAVLGGARDGFRSREPLRRDLSRMYRRNFIEFGTPLRYVRGPVTRRRARGVEGAAEAEIVRRRGRYADRRGALYPRTTSAFGPRAEDRLATPG